MIEEGFKGGEERMLLLQVDRQEIDVESRVSSEQHNRQTRETAEKCCS